MTFSKGALLGGVLPGHWQMISTRLSVTFLSWRVSQFNLAFDDFLSSGALNFIEKMCRRFWISVLISIGDARSLSRISQVKQPSWVKEFVSAFRSSMGSRSLLGSHNVACWPKKRDRMSASSFCSFLHPEVAAPVLKCSCIRLPRVFRCVPMYRYGCTCTAVSHHCAYSCICIT